MDVILNRYSDLENNNFSIEEDYLTFFKKNNGVAPDNAEKLYFQNIVDLYQNQKNPNDSLYTDFQMFIENIIFLFKNDSNYERLRNIDFNDKGQVRIMLPIIVNKLKEIIDYYKEKRNSIKHDRMDFFLNGSQNALEIDLYNTIQALSNKNPDSESDMSSFGLSALQVEYVQLYDLFDYYNSDNQTYVRNLEILSKNPIFFNIVDYLTKHTDAEKADYNQSCVGTDLYNIENEIDLSQKYSGAFVKYLSGFKNEYQTISFEKEFRAGENFFYWLSGETIFEKASEKITKTSIHDLDWSNAVGYNSILSADVIFVDGAEGKKAAWLKSYDNIVGKNDMTANVKNELEFRFPFPFKGLSAEGMEWTGADIKEMANFDLQLFYGKDYQQIQKAVDSSYWSTSSLSLSTANNIYLNETSLVDSGAYGATNYENADKLEIRHTGKDDIFDGIYNNEVNRCWLYDFKETEIPIVPGDNNIYWPLGRYESTDELFYEYKAGDRIHLSSIDIAQQFTGAVASHEFENADKIYRLKTHCGPVVECAWLKGVPLSGLNKKDAVGCTCDENTTIVPTNRRYKNGSIQSYLYFQAKPNEFTKFNAAGLGKYETVELNNIKSLRGYSHDESCQYNHLILNDLFNSSKFNKTDLDINQWKQCNCRAIKHSPFGHRGLKFTDYQSYADYIVVDTMPSTPFNLKTWKGTDGESYKTSRDFAWFRLEDGNDKNIGWGKGRWITGDGSEMVFDAHKQYIYYRTSIDRCEGYNAPYGIFKHTFCDGGYVDDDCQVKSCMPVWTKAIQNTDGIWIDGGVLTDLELESNNFYRYNHQMERSYSTERLTVSGLYVDAPDYEIKKDNMLYAYFIESNNTEVPMNFIWNCPIINAVPYWVNTNLNYETTMIKQ